MPKLDAQISTLQERLKQLKLRQQRSDARKRTLEAQRERKSETRRKFIVGAVILEKAASGEFDRAQLQAWLDCALTRSDDRALFDLPPKTPTLAGAPAPSQDAGGGV
jgi:large subunit ribosomal protein L7/L12